MPYPTLFVLAYDIVTSLDSSQNRILATRKSRHGYITLPILNVMILCTDTDFSGIERKGAIFENSDQEEAGGNRLRVVDTRS